MSDAKNAAELSIDEILATIRRIIADEEQAAATTAGPAGIAAVAAGTAGAGAADREDVLELTEALNEDGTIRHLAPIGGGTVRRSGGSGDAASSGPRIEPEFRPRAAAQAEPEARQPRREAPSLRLTPAAAGGDQREPRLPRELAVGGGERTLEDIVRESLQPLLQAWLDENLPPLVERLVQAEITRVAREAASGG